MTRPTALQVKFDNIPMTLKMIPRWVVWQFVEVENGDARKWAKIPLQAATGLRASSTNPDTWADFLTAQKAYLTGKYDGIGFVFINSDNLIGIDLDDCVDANGQVATEDAATMLENIDGYAERSPSATGVKIFTRTTLQSAHVDHAKGLEIYPHARYFTVTGHHIQGAIPEHEIDLSPFIPPRTIHRSGDDFADYTPPVDDYDLARVEREILTHLPPDCGYTDWLMVGMAMHHQFQGSDDALEMWDNWSYQNGDCPSYSPNECRRKWATFSKKGGATLRSLIFKINQTKKQEALARGEIVLDQAPLDHARNFLEANHTTEEGVRLVHYSEDYFVHRATHYEEVEEATIRSQLYKFLDKCKKTDRRGNLVPFMPTPATVTAALDATKALTHLENHANTKPPVWLDGYAQGKPAASKLISVKNGLFHLEESVLLPHSLGFFTQNSLPFDYDPYAKCPTWEMFLTQIWGHDQESIDTLQEIFGYVLSGDTRQQKFFNVIGPRRSGKGTINKVLVELLGQHNTVAPELGELCDTFGLQPWLGKLLASFTDARAPERNRSAVVSQLLRIVGGDTVTVNRKNKEAWNGYLPTRIIVYSNEVLQLTENSNALTGRMIVLKMTQSFYGKEDTELASKLMKELSGIFNWSMVGLRRRMERGGHFLQPTSGVDLLEIMEDLSNPINLFYRDVLIEDPEGTVDKDDLFKVFKKWSQEKGMHPGTDLSFKRKFLAATQDKPISTAVSRVEGRRENVYRGVKLTDKAQGFVNSLSEFNERIF
jgi:putative DNA primase/helicase